MKSIHQLELINSNILDDSLSNASGCGLPPVCSETKVITTSERKCKKVFGKEVCSNVPVVKKVTNQECIDKKNKYKSCKENSKSDNENKGSKNIFNKSKDKLKKKVTSIKEKKGKSGKKLRNKLRKLITKDILYKLRNNIHGISNRLYPAIASENELKNKKYKKSYISKSKKIYSDLLSRWLKMGGNENELRSAIIEGAKKRRFAKSPYKSFAGYNDSYGFYEYFSYNDGEGEKDQTEDIASEEEKKKGVRGFFAWLLSLFKKNNANENPFEEGSTENREFNKDNLEDEGNQPDESEANNDVLNELDKTADEDEVDKINDDENKILGIDKNTFYILASILGVSIIGLSIYALKKK
jgi:hypothetical protein